MHTHHASAQIVSFYVLHAWNASCIQINSAECMELATECAFLGEMDSGNCIGNGCYLFVWIWLLSQFFIQWELVRIATRVNFAFQFFFLFWIELKCVLKVTTSRAVFKYYKRIFKLKCIYGYFHSFLCFISNFKGGRFPHTTSADTRWVRPSASNGCSGSWLLPFHSF